MRVSRAHIDSAHERSVNARTPSARRHERAFPCYSLGNVQQHELQRGSFMNVPPRNEENQGEPKQKEEKGNPIHEVL